MVEKMKSGPGEREQRSGFDKETELKLGEETHISEEEELIGKAKDKFTPEKDMLKSILLGVVVFIIFLITSFFFADMYVNKKKVPLKSDKTEKNVIKYVAKNEKKIIVKHYNLKPFFLRLKNSKTGEDRFLLALLYIEFIRKDLPGEIKTNREVLRMLTYKQLKKHFTGIKGTPEAEKKFKKELIPALNIFFKGGGVYDIVFKKLVIR